MKQYKVVIFDLDGTLADTSEGIFNSIRFAQKTMNLKEITPEQMRSHVGPPMAVSYNKNFGLEGEELEHAIALHKQYALEKGAFEVSFYDGIDELLSGLRKNDCMICVATLKIEQTAKKIMEHFGKSGFFDLIRGVTAGGNETKASILRNCVEFANADISQCVLIGDSVYDAQGAQEVGMDFIGVTYGFGFKNKEEVFQSGAVAVADSCTELSQILLKK